MTSVGAGALLVTEREPAAVYGSSWRTAQLTNGWMNRCTFVCLRFIPFCSKQRSLPSERERVRESELDKHSTGEERNSSTGIWRERIQICVSIQENRKREREREMVGVCSRAVWVLGLVFHVKDNRIVPSHIHPKNCVSCKFSTQKSVSLVWELISFCVLRGRDSISRSKWISFIFGLWIISSFIRSYTNKFKNILYLHRPNYTKKRENIYFLKWKLCVCVFIKSPAVRLWDVRWRR